MSEQNETSYYEIALTNRQVMMAFVLLLGAVLVAFVSGVWLGRGERQLPRGDEQVATLPSTQQVPDIEELQFYSEGAAVTEPEGESATDGGLRKPDLSSLRGGRDSSAAKQPTTLAQDVGSPGATRDAAPPLRPNPAKPTVEPAAKPRIPTPRAAEPDEGFIIQVFSTREEAQAKKVLQRLSSGGYPAYLSPVEVKNQTMYRVRLGPYKDRGRADKVGAEVERKFEYDTWITAASN